MPGFSDGNIKLLKLKDFQTFQEALFNFHPLLNFIVGPNGSGKSSVVNAMTFVFGGTLRTVGKVGGVGEYVRFGEDEGWVEAVVQMGGEDMSFRRCVTRDNHSKYFVDGKLCKKAEYDVFIGRFRENVENMCRFLPQEKVAEFASLSPEDLLVAMLSAVGNASVLEEMKGFGLLEKEEARIKEDIALKLEQICVAERTIKSVAKEVEKAKERECREGRVRLMQEKLDWMHYAMHSGEYARRRGVINGIKENIRRKRLEVLDIERRLSEMTRSLPEERFSDSCDVLRNYDDVLAGMVDELKGVLHDSDIFEIDVKSLEGRKERRLQAVKRLLLEIQNLEDESTKIGTKALQHRPEFDGRDICILEGKLSELTKARTRIQCSSSELKYEMEGLYCKKRKLCEAKEKKMEMLKRYHLDTYRSVCWLRENAHKFKDEIIEPPYLGMEINNMDYAPEVETFFSFQILSPFIFKSSEDFEMFVRVIKDEKRWG